MENMSAFFVTLLQAVASFFAAEPIIYLFGVVVLLFIIKAFKMIVT